MNKNNMKVIAIIIVFLIAGFIGFLISNNKEQKKKENNTVTSNVTNNSVTNNTTNTTNTVPTNTTKYSQEQLEKMSLDYYEVKNNYRPGSVSSEMTADGKLAIQLYDNMGDHNSTSAWYTVDMNTAKGTDTLGNPIDLNDKTTTANEDGISEIKKALKNEEWLKQNATMQKSCFGEDITADVEWNFINVVNANYSPTVVVLANADKNTSIQAFILTNQNGKIVSNPLPDTPMHSGHCQILVDPNNAMAMVSYMHMGVNMTTVYDIKSGEGNPIATFSREEQYNSDINGISVKYYTVRETEISEEEYNQLSRKYDVTNFHEIGTKVTSSNVDRFIS